MYNKKGKMRRVLALVSATILAIGMSVTTFAADNTVNATVKFAVDKELYNTESVTFDNQNFTHEFEIDPGATYTITEPTVMDALLKAYKQYNQGSFTSDQVAYGWDTTSVPNGAYISIFDGVGTETIDYGSNYWKGNSWMMYTKDGATYNLINSYATGVPLTDGMDIMISYDYIEQQW